MPRRGLPITLGQWRTALWSPILLFAAVAVFHLWALMRYPPPFVDEVWAIDRAWAFIRTGRVFGQLDVGVWDRFDGYWTFFPWIPTAVQSLSIRLFAAPSLLGVRLVSLAFGLALLGSAYAIGRRFGGSGLGMLSALVVSLSSPFVYSAHLGRFDIFAAAFGYAAVALHLNNGCSRVWVSALSGLLVGLAFESHAHGAIFGPAIAALFLWEYRGRVWRQRHAWGFAAGVAGGLLLYAGLHVLRYPDTYAAINRLAFAPSHIPPMLTGDWRVILKAFADMATLMFGAYLTLIALLVWALVSLAGERDGVYRPLLVLGPALVLGHTLLIRNKSFYYAILFTPATDLVIAAFLFEFFRRPWRGTLNNYAEQAIVWGLCASFVLIMAQLLRGNGMVAYEATQRRINGDIRPGDAIMGPQTYWLDLREHTYYSWEGLIYYQRYMPGSTLEDAFREFRPNILIIDNRMDSSTFDAVAGGPRPTYFRISPAELDSFLECRGSLIDEFDGGPYRRVRVYRLVWMEASPSDRGCLPAR